MPKKPTQNDVAKLAGVSRGTVSMVLSNKINGRVPISDETIERVLQAAQALGYAPNPVAQMLKEGSNQLIGVFAYEPVFPYDTGTFLFSHLVGIERAASEQDYDVIFFTRHRKRTTTPKIYVNNMNSLRLADGTVILGSFPDRDELRRLVDEHYPFVYIGRREVPGCEINWVTHDYIQWSRVATDHLIELGHRRLGFVEDFHAPVTEPSEDKLGGVRLAVENAPHVELALLDFSNGDAFVEQVRAQKVTALLVPDPTDFITAYQYLQQHGLSVPDDVSVVTLVDIDERLPDGISPTYVAVDRQSVAEVAVRTLTGLLDGSLQSPQNHLIPSRFVIGNTSAGLERSRLR